MNAIVVSDSLSVILFDFSPIFTLVPSFVCSVVLSLVFSLCLFFSKALGVPLLL